jgi:hypothetical protein
LLRTWQVSLFGLGKQAEEFNQSKVVLKFNQSPLWKSIEKDKNGNSTTNLNRTLQDIQRLAGIACQPE